MTPVQSMRREGFLASLAARGVSLSVAGMSIWVSGGITTGRVSALIQPTPPDTGDYSQADFERESSDLHILREQVPPSIVIGSVFVDSGALVRHRVTKIKDDATNIAVVFTCESAPYTPTP